MSLFSSRVFATARRGFSSSALRSDLAKVTLIGHLGKSPELKVGKSGTEYVMYGVSTSNGTRPAADGGREDAPPSWHTVFSFNPNTSQYLVNLPKGSLVYVEGSLGYRDIEGSVGQQAVIRHETLRVLRRGKGAESDVGEPIEEGKLQ